MDFLTQKKVSTGFYTEVGLYGRFFLVSALFLFGKCFVYLIMENNLKGNIMTAKDFGMTEDEYNNFMIELYEGMKKNNEHLENAGIMTEGLVESIKITLTPKCFVNYMDLGEQSN